jgi:hypothetical protein
MEFRTRKYGDSNLSVDKIEVKEITETEYTNNQETKKIYEAEYLPKLNGEEIEDVEASINLARKCDTNCNGFAVFGPYTYDQEVNKTYQADYYLKLETNSTSQTPNPKILTIDVYGIDNNSTSKLIEKKEIYQNDLTSTYQAHSIDFTKPEQGRLEFRVRKHDDASVLIDRIEVGEVI